MHPTKKCTHKCACLTAPKTPLVILVRGDPDDGNKCFQG